MFEVLYACEEALFGLMWQDYFDNEQRDEQPRITYDKTNEYFQQLSQEFTTNDVKTVWGYTSNATASERIRKLIEAGVVKKLRQGHFQKLKSAA
jgi:predicted HTH transcriptional regulator